MAPITYPNPPPFPIAHGDDEDAATAPSNRGPLSPFTVSTARGFLPLCDPPSALPAAFAPLERLLQAMPVRRADGLPGLLARGAVGAAVDGRPGTMTGDGDDEGGPLLDLSREVVRWATGDPVLATALYRDYSFLASAYLLEPCHLRAAQGLDYGLARSTLPRNIAVPLDTVARIAGFKPWMEYAGSYALYNYRLANPSLGLSYDNLRLIRAFEHGLDPHSSEAGFVLVHVAMVRHSGPLVAGALATLEACECGDRERFDEGLAEVVAALEKVNGTMNEMWNKSKPRDYTTFRTFIFGIANQSMFPDGVLYEGVSPERQFFRGESGANDSMIPLCDNLLQLSMPDNPLTEILRDFRSYRPGNHREFLEWVHAKASHVGTKRYALADAHSARLHLAALDQVRDFRWRHWCFTREYILKHSKHRTATGGSPIVTWLPNQLQAVLAQMVEAGRHCVGEKGVGDILDEVETQRRTLAKEVDKYCQEQGA